MAKQNDGTIDGVKLTQMERDAIKHARARFAAALERHGLMPAFFNLTADQIDEVIGAAVNGFRDGMQNDEIPF